MTQTNAMLCALAAFFSWVLVDAVIKYAGLTDLSPFAIIGIMGIIGAAGVATSALSNKSISVLYSRGFN